jgi:hypothetical protein
LHPAAFSQQSGDTTANLETPTVEWAQLDKEEMGEITRNHLRGLVRAIHKYHDENGSCPPAVAGGLGN